MYRSYPQAEFDDEADGLGSAYGTDEEITHHHNPNNGNRSNQLAQASQPRSTLCIVRNIFPSTMMLLMLLFRFVTKSRHIPKEENNIPLAG